MQLLVVSGSEGGDATALLRMIWEVPLVCQLKQTEPLQHLSATQSA